jgi:hypothetical protein
MDGFAAFAGRTWRERIRAIAVARASGNAARVGAHTVAAIHVVRALTTFSAEPRLRNAVRAVGRAVRVGNAFHASRVRSLVGHGFIAANGQRA